MFRPLSALLLALPLVTATGCNKSETADTKAPTPPAVELSLKGVDTSTLTNRERREWAAEIAELKAPCPEVQGSIAQCVREAKACKACLPAAQLLLRLVKEGRPHKDREEAYKARFDPSRVKTLSVDGSPFVGPADAPVTIVEWADFECPFCRIVTPMLDGLVHRFPGQVRVVFKFYPLDGHVRGEPAARAVAAAGRQGRFWEMHHTLFDNQDKLEPADIERYAKQLGLDLPKFRVDLTGAEVKAHVARDKAQGEQVGLDGTPFMFINGRYVPLQLLGNPVEDLVEWVKLELEMLGHTPAAPAAAPAVAGSAAARPATSAAVAAPPK